MSEPRDMIVQVFVQSLSAAERTELEAICRPPCSELLRALVARPVRRTFDPFRLALGPDGRRNVAEVLTAPSRTLFLHALGETDPLEGAPLHVHHVATGTRGIEELWCGSQLRRISGEHRVFRDPNHAISYTAHAGGRMLLCPVCVLVMTHVLAAGMWDGSPSEEEREEPHAETGPS